MKYICDHKSISCGKCKHAEPHDPIEVSPFAETCVMREGVCLTPFEEVKCIPAPNQ